MPNRDPLPRFADGIALRRLAAADLPAFQRYRRDPEVGRYQGWSAMADAEARAFLAEMSSVALFTPGRWSQIAIADAISLELIGDIGLFLSADDAQAEIGFTLCPQAQGKGRGSAAVRVAMGLVFEQTGVERILGITDSRNAPSIRLLERVGMDRSESRAGEFRGESCIEQVYVIQRRSGRFAGNVHAARDAT